MHISVLKVMICRIHHAIETMSVKIVASSINYTASPLGTGALFGCSGAPTVSATGGGAQIIGVGAGLRWAPAQFNPCLLSHF